MSRVLANLVNQEKRRCRIGKVTLKKKDLEWRELVQPLKPIWPFNSETGWRQTYMDTCGCKVGSACGNVACPHRLEATC